MPEVMEMYKLDELTTIGTLQSNIKKMFWKNSKFTDPGVSHKAIKTKEGKDPPLLDDFAFPN